MYCDIALLKKSMPNIPFDGSLSSLVTETDLQRWCDRIASQMDTKFAGRNIDIPITEDQIISIVGDEDAGTKVYDTIILANVYGTRQVVYTTLATDDGEESEMAKMNKDLFDEAMDDILRALGGARLTSSRGTSSGRERDPIVKLRDGGLW